ncbi:MAG TPA: hypothetical protein VKB80_00145 [Kofleriaceae bacterium]|nr:hypothetical protein [Kofleriaceae bacterium]
MKERGPCSHCPLAQATTAAAGAPAHAAPAACSFDAGIATLSATLDGDEALLRTDAETGASRGWS